MRRQSNKSAAAHLILNILIIFLFFADWDHESTAGDVFDRIMSHAVVGGRFGGGRRTARGRRRPTPGY